MRYIFVALDSKNYATIFSLPSLQETTFLQVPLTPLKIAMFIITRRRACRSHANVALEVALSKPFTWK